MATAPVGKVQGSTSPPPRDEKGPAGGQMAVEGVPGGGNEDSVWVLTIGETRTIQCKGCLGGLPPLILPRTEIMD